ncbi:MAG: hypothetical protein AMXMBFR13_19650 [Phycisphaerae bacterium]
MRTLPLWLFVLTCPIASAAAEPARYFAHEVRTDRHGVIAPWYPGLNGQCDFRARIAAETMKRYPWAADPKNGPPAPDYVYNGRWSIDADGTIHPGELQDWGNGDLTQRGAYALFGWLDYYRYTGDPAAVAHIWMIADVILNNCQTPPEHPWPGFLVSVPNRGEPYGLCDPRGMIQLDLVGLFGLALTQGYQLTGNPAWFEAVQRWGDLLARHHNPDPRVPPWNRYANPEDVHWEDLQTGGVILIIRFLDELIRVGYTGTENAIIKARDAGLAYLRDVLLPRWLQDDTWGRDYWDWQHAAMGETYAEMVPRYLTRHPELFPNWRVDARNILSLYLNRSSVSVESNSDVFHGAWGYPESCQCCDRSLSYPPMQVGAAFAEYGVRADSEWARELARRQFILATYDAHETGVVEDNIDGGQVVAGGWFQISHPLPLKYVLHGIGWLPEVLGANRENHIVRSITVVRNVTYEDGRIAFETFDAPVATQTVLRLAFKPTQVAAGGRPLALRSELDANGYTLKELTNSDSIVSVRHDAETRVEIRGDDPQESVSTEALQTSGPWVRRDTASDEEMLTTTGPGASLEFTFEGNQVRLLGRAAPEGGRADVYLDGVRQLCGIDCWNPASRSGVLWYRNGLSDGRHTLRVVASGERNPRSAGSRVTISGIQYSDARGDAGFGSGGGPTGPQRWILGYPEREDYIDSDGHAWRPGGEVIIRLGETGDSVATSWHTAPRRWHVANTRDPIVYRHGVHGRDFTAYVTVRPGTYHVRLKFMEHRSIDPAGRAVNVLLNGRSVVEGMDIAATAAGRPASVITVLPNRVKVYEGLNTAVDLVFNEVQPEHGVIAIRMTGSNGGEAILSAIEVAPGSGAQGAQPIAAP